MHGWCGRILRVNLTKMKHSFSPVDLTTLANFIGGRGLAAKILWDELPPGVDPLSPHNKLVIATGPLSGMPCPSSGKVVIASKSPLTHGYGDGSIGTWVSVQLRKACYDAVVIEGRSEKPVYLYIEDERVEIIDARDLWGLDTFTTEDKLIKEHGRGIGTLIIGPGGENLVKYATVVSMKGRSGGRPGLGAVMGSKKLKAIVVKGSKEPSLANKSKYLDVAKAAYENVLRKEGYDFWIRQGTMATIVWSHKNSVLPTMNFREGVFDEYEGISGDFMEKIKVERRGCPYCNMQCGNVILDQGGEKSELDYENVAMLGSNILLGDLRKVGVLNRLCDMYGLDTISMGNCLAFVMEASERGLISDKVEWGDFNEVKQLIEDTAYRRGLGDFLAEGTMRMSFKLKGGSEKWAMHVKGLEISAYNCHTAPGMALAYGTSPIGAHHKDAWIIAYEVKSDRMSYSESKVAKLIELQRIRGGIFESITTCRFPWIELGLSLDYYSKLLTHATGITYSLEDLYIVADRIYTLIRALWIREIGGWSALADYPPARWFEEPLNKGPYAGHKLDLEGYSRMLAAYYDHRGWDERGVPTKGTLAKLGLNYVASELEKYIELK